MNKYYNIGMFAYIFIIESAKLFADTLIEVYRTESNDK